MRVTFAGARRPAVRAAAAAAGACAKADAGLDTPPSAAPTTPPSDFAKLLRSTAIPPHAIVTAGRTRAVPLMGALYAPLCDHGHNGQAIRSQPTRCEDTARHHREV